MTSPVSHGGKKAVKTHMNGVEVENAVLRTTVGMLCATANAFSGGHICHITTPNRVSRGTCAVFVVVGTRDGAISQIGIRTIGST